MLLILGNVVCVAVNCHYTVDVVRVEKYGNKDGIPAVFQILYFIGWKPDKSQVTLLSISCIHLKSDNGCL